MAGSPTNQPIPVSPPRCPVSFGTANGQTALLYTDKAPLANLAKRLFKCDFEAVWAHVPERNPQKLTVLVYYHGHKNYVTIKPDGSSTTPDWAPNMVERDFICERAEGWLKGLGSTLPKPIVLEPEVAWPVKAHWVDGKTPGTKVRVDEFPGTPDPDKPKTMRFDPKKVNYSTNYEGEMFQWDSADRKWEVGAAALSERKPKDYDKAWLSAFLKECLQHLKGLPPKAYLETSAESFSRLFISGHSGGGVPLRPSAMSDIVYSTPTDLILLDCLYSSTLSSMRKKVGAEHDEFIHYCATLKASGKLGNEAEKSRMVVVSYDTVTGLNNLHKNLVSQLKLSKHDHLDVAYEQYFHSFDRHKTDQVKRIEDAIQGKTVVRILGHKMEHASGLVELALRSVPIVFITTAVKHCQVPEVFLPMVLDTAQIA